MATVRELITKIIFKADTRGAKDADKSAEKVKKGMENAGKAAQEAGRKVGTAFNGVASSVGQGTTALGRLQNRAGQVASAASAAMLRIQSAIRGVGNEASIAAAKMGGMNAKNISAKGGNLASNGAMAAMAGGAMLAPLVGSANTAMDFQASMSKVQAITGATTEGMAALTAKARELGETTQFSASQAGEAMSYLGMAGWKTEQIIAGMPGLLNLAAASGEDLARVADIVSDDLTAFHMSAEDAGRMADIMAAASSNANTNVSMMGETFKYAGAAAGAMGYKFEDVAVATGLMANAGIKGEMAGTSLRSMFTRMATDTGAINTLNQLGIATKDATGNMLPLRDVIQNMREKFKELSESEATAAAKSIAGQEALSGFLAVAQSSDEDFNKLTSAIDASNGAASEMARLMNDNARGDLKDLSSAFESLQLNIFGDGQSNKGMQEVRDLIQSITKEVLDLGKWISEHGEIVAMVMKIVAVLGVLLTILGTIGIFVGGLMQLAPIFSTIVSVVTAVASAIWTVIQIIALLVGASAGAVAAIVAGVVLLAYLIYNYWDEIGAFISNEWEYIKKKSQEFMDWCSDGIHNLVKSIKGFFADMGDYIMGIIDTISGGISGLIDGAMRFLGMKGDIANVSSRMSSGGGSGGSYTTNNNGGNTYNFNVPNTRAANQVYDFVSSYN